jgi:hypothetical protein
MQVLLIPQNLLLTKLEKTRNPQDKSIIRATGFISATIIHMGPDYRSLIASFQTHQDWLNSWNGHYNKTSDLEMLRRKNEVYTARIMSYEERDVARVRNIQSPSTVAWRIAGGCTQRSSAPGYAAEFEGVSDDISKYEPAQSNGPRICLGTAGLIGLVPPAARAGDIVVQFRNCSAAIIMRPIVDPRAPRSKTTDGPASSSLLVGRADIAEAHERKDTPGYDTHVKQRPSASYEDPVFEGSQASRVVCVDLDLRTLQIITASISTF